MVFLLLGFFHFFWLFNLQGFFWLLVHFNCFCVFSRGFNHFRLAFEGFEKFGCFRQIVAVHQYIVDQHKRKHDNSKQENCRRVGQIEGNMAFR